MHYDRELECRFLRGIFTYYLHLLACKKRKASFLRYFFFVCVRFRAKINRLKKYSALEMKWIGIFRRFY